MLRINLHDLCSTSRPLFTKSNLVVAGASAHTASVGALVESTSGCSTGASDGSASVGCSTGASDGSASVGCSTGASDGSASVGCSTGASDGSSMNGIET